MGSLGIRRSGIIATCMEASGPAKKKQRLERKTKDVSAYAKSTPACFWIRRASQSQRSRLDVKEAASRESRTSSSWDLMPGSTRSLRFRIEAHDTRDMAIWSQNEPLHIEAMNYPTLNFLMLRSIGGGITEQSGTSAITSPTALFNRGNVSAESRSASIEVQRTSGRVREARGGSNFGLSPSKGGFRFAVWGRETPWWPTLRHWEDKGRYKVTKKALHTARRGTEELCAAAVKWSPDASQQAPVVEKQTRWPLNRWCGAGKQREWKTLSDFECSREF
ncbi:hypothetical protein B0H13DRAFT_2528871 [Mycena leptocephala]|nr:hypothetical protein B0H13DRAFT_2528871 [Mycena leptocephala]